MVDIEYNEPVFEPGRTLVLNFSAVFKVIHKEELKFENNADKEKRES